MVFNISLNSIKFLSDKYQQASFFFIKRDGQDLVVEYWEKDDVYKPYSKSRNDYMCKNTVFTVEQVSEAEDFSQIPKRLKLTFPSELFDSVHQLMPVVNQVWDIIVDGVGLSAFYRRKSLNREGFVTLFRLLFFTLAFGGFAEERHFPYSRSEKEFGKEISAHHDGALVWESQPTECSEGDKGVGNDEKDSSEKDGAVGRLCPTRQSHTRLFRPVAFQ